jgi:hypothetical protein
MPCNKNPDCPADNACQTWMCDTGAGMCVTTCAPMGTVASGGTDGDCKAELCNGVGQTTTGNLDTDTPMDDGDPCTIEACMNGAPSTTNAPVGTNCPGGKCNDMGVCAECNVDGDCATGMNPSCFMGQCISCSDGMQNGDETDMDCGGTKCGKCDGDTCAAGGDCKSTFCADGVCCNNACNTECKSCNQAATMGVCTNIPLGMTDMAPACDNTNVCNGAGVCKLKNGEMCTNNASCASNNCTGNPKTCQP